MRYDIIGTHECCFNFNGIFSAVFCSVFTRLFLLESEQLQKSDQCAQGPPKGDSQNERSIRSNQVDIVDVNFITQLSLCQTR